MRKKPPWRQFFDTPLLFSIKEAKGLEYESVILVNFISNERTSFEEIINGVSREDLNGDFEYMRARDKTDKSWKSISSSLILFMLQLPGPCRGFT